MLHGKSQVKAMILAQVNAAHLDTKGPHQVTVQCDAQCRISLIPNKPCISHPRHQNISRLWQSFHLAGFSQLSLTINAVSSLPKNCGSSTPKISRTNRYHDRINSPEKQLVPKMFIHIILRSSHLCHRLCLC